METWTEAFHKIAAKVACAVGSPWAFACAALVVVGWAVAGPMLGYSDHWQLFINTGTTIATFLMLFVLQNSQNRDTKAVNIKLDELLRAIDGARTGLATVGDLSEADLDRIESEFRKIAAREGIPSHDALAGLRDRVEPERVPTNGATAAEETDDRIQGGQSGRSTTKRGRRKLTAAKTRR